MGKKRKHSERGEGVTQPKKEEVAPESHSQAHSVAAQINANSAMPRAVVAQVKSLFDSAQRAFDSPLHILVNSAGINDGAYPSFADTTVESFDLIFAVNARVAFACTREAANCLKRGGGGRIILLTMSLVAALKPGYGTYTASKAVVEAMAKILAVLRREMRKGVGLGDEEGCSHAGHILGFQFLHWSIIKLI